MLEFKETHDLDLVGVFVADCFFDFGAVEEVSPVGLEFEVGEELEGKTEE